jgi:hypothetical protein
VIHFHLVPRLSISGATPPLTTRLRGVTFNSFKVWVGLPSTRWCLYFDVMVGHVWSNDPEIYAGGSIATGRATHAG